MGIALYFTEVAEHLAASGHHVEVVTTAPHYPQWRIAPEHRARRRVEQHNGVKITRLWLYVPAEQTALRRAAYEASFVVHALADHRPARTTDLVVSVVPNVGNAALGWLWSRPSRARWLMCVQDLSGRGAKEAGLRGGARIARLVTRAEASLARRADLVTVCSPGYRDALADEGVPPDRITEFPDWCRLPAPSTPRDAVRARLAWMPEERIVLHAGNMGMKQGLERVFDYAAEAQRLAPNLRFVLLGDGNQRSALAARAAHTANVDLMAPISEGELPNVLAAADILFVHERPGLREMSVPSKLTAYFSSGRPIVSAVHPASGTARAVEESGAGRVVPSGDASAVARTLSDLACDPEAAAELGARGLEYAGSTLGREAAMARLDRIVERVMRGD